MTPSEPRARLERLRPRDWDIVRALVEHTGLSRRAIAARIGMGFGNLNDRLKAIFDWLDVSSRIELHVIYGPLIVERDPAPKERD